MQAVGCPRLLVHDKAVLFPARHSVGVPDSSLTIAGWLSARFCAAAQPTPQTCVTPALQASRLCTGKLFTQGVRCCAPRPADLVKEGQLESPICKLQPETSNREM